MSSGLRPKTRCLKHALGTKADASVLGKNLLKPSMRRSIELSNIRWRTRERTETRGGRCCRDFHTLSITGSTARTSLFRLSTDGSTPLVGDAERNCGRERATNRTRLPLAGSFRSITRSRTGGPMADVNDALWPIAPPSARDLKTARLQGELPNQPIWAPLVTRKVRRSKKSSP